MQYCIGTVTREMKKKQSCLWCRYRCFGGDKPLTVWDRGEETLIPQTVFPTCETSSSPECRAGDQSQAVWRWLWSPHVNMFTHKVTHNTIQKINKTAESLHPIPRHPLTPTNNEAITGISKQRKSTSQYYNTFCMKTYVKKSHFYSSNLCRSNWKYGYPISLFEPIYVNGGFNTHCFAYQHIFLKILSLL